MTCNLCYHLHHHSLLGSVSKTIQFSAENFHQHILCFSEWPLQIRAHIRCHSRIDFLISSAHPNFAYHSLASHFVSCSDPLLNCSFTRLPRNLITLTKTEAYRPLETIAFNSTYTSIPSWCEDCEWIICRKCKETWSWLSIVRSLFCMPLTS